MPEYRCLFTEHSLSDATRVVATCVRAMVPAFRWIAIGWIVVFWRLGYPSLLDPDEAHYAELTREMLHSGSWLVPLLDGQPFIDKPVLFHWLQGASVLAAWRNGVRGAAAEALAALGLFRDDALGRARRSSAPKSALRAPSCSRPFPRRSRWPASRSSTWCSRCSCSARVGCLLVAAKRSSAAARAVRLRAADARGDDQRPGRAGARRALVRGGAGVARRETRGAVRAAALEGRACRRWSLAASPWFVWMGWRFGDDFVTGLPARRQPVVLHAAGRVLRPRRSITRSTSARSPARSFRGAPSSSAAASICSGGCASADRSSSAESACSGSGRWSWSASSASRDSSSITTFFPAAPACCLIAAHALAEAARDNEGRLWGTRYGVLARGRPVDRRRELWRRLSVDTSILRCQRPRFSCRSRYSQAACGLLFQAERSGWRVPASAGVLVVIALLVSYATVVVVGFPALEQVRPTARVARLARRARHR